MKGHTLEARKLLTGYDNRAIIENMNITLPENKISVIIGGNGCGKSTLLKTFCRVGKIMDGEILLDGRRMSDYDSKELAQIIGLLPQSPVVPEGISVIDLVSRGRFPYQKFMRGMNNEDYEAVKEALELMNISHLADCSVDELSGGQRQRVWIALALAQQTDILFLDEPTTYLDIAYQVEILEFLKELNRKKNTTIVMVLHELNLAVRYADYIFAMKDGKLVKEGAPREIVNTELLEEVFRLKAEILEDPVTESLVIVPIGRVRN